MGKTAIAVELAKEINGEIISADSMQIYKYMDIGTAKPSVLEREGIPHYLIDEVYPDEEFSVAVFQKLSQKYISAIYDKEKIPIIAGGTGFYINGLLYNNDFNESQIDPQYRDQLYLIAKEKGNEYLHSLLKEVDEEAASRVHFNNVKRVVRALEFYHSTGCQISWHNKKEKAKEPFFDARFFILNMDRKKLYAKIDLRVDAMIEDGLVDETIRLLERGYHEGLVSMQGLGYREIIKHLKGDFSLPDAIELIKRNTRHYAKRQFTWFRGQCDGYWMDVDGSDSRDIINAMLRLECTQYGKKFSGCNS